MLGDGYSGYEQEQYAEIYYFVGLANEKIYT